jgi:hypothetical protein
MNRRTVAGAAIAAALTALLMSSAAPAAPFSFAVFGDTPYDDGYPGAETQSYLDMLAEIGRSDARFVVHVGDFKHGATPCSDNLFEQRHAEFAMFAVPFILAFGDNEWTDCWRSAADPLERLAKLRILFAAGNESLGRTRIALTRQSENSAYAAYPENVRWADAGILFVVLNVPGSNNNRGRMPDEYASRNAANLAWLAEAFAIARTRAFGTLVIFMQANPFLGQRAPTGYTALLEALRGHVSRFAGRVALVHGDSHRCRIDYPLWDPVARRYFPNLQRIETFGSPRVNWLLVTADANAGQSGLHVTPGRASDACCRREPGPGPCS